jgi:hypothetical protein
MSAIALSAAEIPALRAPRRGRWKLLVMLVLMLLFFVWAGSAANPRDAMPWGWTGTGWLTLSRGLAFLWVASAAVFAVLSRLAYRLFTDLPAPRRSGMLATIFIVMACAAANAVIVLWWHPMSLADPRAVETLSWRIGTAAVSMATLIVLLLALSRENRSGWWAVLFALHPVVLLETAGNGAAITLLALPVLLLAWSVPRWQCRVRSMAMIVSAIVAVAIAALLAVRPPFNSISTSLLAFIPDRQEMLWVGGVQVILQSLVLFVAWRRKWPFVRTLTHVLVMLLIGLTGVYPAMVVVVLPLLALGWNRAGWVLSLTVLLAYAAIPAERMTHHWRVPEILVALEWVPVVVVEMQELFVWGHAEA